MRPVCPAAHREVFPSVEHRTGRYENNRAEVSHQHTREQERQMRRFKSVVQAQRFLCVHGQIQNLFRVSRNHLKSVHHRLVLRQNLICLVFAGARRLGEPSARIEPAAN